ncbi:MAG: Ig-like domain-containing protein [Acidimicrobiia bacterium]
MRYAGTRSRGRSSVTAVLLIMCCVAIAVTVRHEARSHESGNGTATELRAELAASVSFAPTPGATSVAPDSPIVVTARMGRLVSVRVASASGTNVRGSFARSGVEWRSSGILGYGTVYHVIATLSGAARQQADSTMQFRTLTPPSPVSAIVFPWQGQIVGVGQPVLFTFNQPISYTARASLLTHLSVKESPAIAGGWHWFSDHELHFRPQTFWPAGAHVTVTWNLAGWNAGADGWGTSEGTVHFTVGNSHVSYANLWTDEMTVIDNGQTIATYPISGGTLADPTMDGVHIVLDRSSVVRMVSSTNGIPVNSADGYDELVYDDVRISDSGEYVHSAPWSVSSQGNANVSHGCINLSPANAAAFFAFSQFGDVIVVTGSPRPPAVGDHGVMDWDTRWSAFTASP